MEDSSAIARERYRLQRVGHRLPLAIAERLYRRLDLGSAFVFAGDWRSTSIDSGDGNQRNESAHVSHRILLSRGSARVACSNGCDYGLTRFRSLSAGFS